MNWKVNPGELNKEGRMLSSKEQERVKLQRKKAEYKKIWTGKNTLRLLREFRLKYGGPSEASERGYVYKRSGAKLKSDRNKLMDDNLLYSRVFRRSRFSKYDHLLRMQEGRCAICEKAEVLALDHEHVTGHIRGLLCRSCNMGLGSFRDIPSRLRTASIYLNSFNNRQDIFDVVKHVERGVSRKAAVILYLIKLQEGRCAICEDTAPLALDHSHDTGRIRGMICRNCNLGVGFFKDTPDLLRTAANYLEFNKE